VIEHATRYRFAGDANVDAAVVTGDLQWRRMGGDAHALGWQMLFSHMEWAPDNDPEVLGRAAVTADIDGLLQAPTWAASFLRVAKDRYVELSTAPAEA